MRLLQASRACGGWVAHSFDPAKPTTEVASASPAFGGTVFPGADGLHPAAPSWADPSIIATAGDTTLKLWQTEKTANAARVEMLSFSTYHPAAWLHFARDADGSDRALLNAQPFFPLEIWPGSRTPVTATSANKISPLKVQRAR